MLSPTLAFDEERQMEKQGRSWKPPMRWCRLPRLKKPVIMLLVLDIIFVGLLVHLLEPLITLLRRNDQLFAPRVMPIQTNGTLPAQHKIPRILHQTVANETIPDKWIEPQKSCKEVYHDFEYKLWTDQSAHDFLAAEYPWFVESWDNYAFPIQRADSIRYFLLHHFGGIYLDMDTVCKEQYPLHEIGTDDSPHASLLKSTEPTGITNDFMIASAKHPAFTTAIEKLPFFYTISRFWSDLLPYCSIMFASGPLFLTLAIKDYMLGLDELPTSTVQVISPEALAPFIIDLQSSSWHRADAQTLMWLGHRPWAWFTLGGIGVAIGLSIANFVALKVYKGFNRRGRYILLS